MQDSNQMHLMIYPQLIFSWL